MPNKAANVTCGINANLSKTVLECQEKGRPCLDVEACFMFPAATLAEFFFFFAHYCQVLLK